MRISHIVLSVIHLVISVMLIAGGVVLFRVFENPELSLKASAFIMHKHSAIKTAALFLIVLGGVLIFLLYLLSKKRYYEVAIPSASCTVDLEILKGYAKNFWHKSFSEADPIKDIYLDEKGNLYLTATTLEDSLSKEMEKLEKIQKQFSNLLREKTGFDKNIFLTVVKDN